MIIYIGIMIHIFIASVIFYATCPNKKDLDRDDATVALLLLIGWPIILPVFFVVVLINDEIPV